MKHYIFAGILIVLGVVGITYATASATDDAPCGGLLDFKYDGLSGYTFTIPTPPAWLTVEYAVVKVGGPGGGTHIVFDPASAGDTLDVSYQQYQISHVHVCKSRTEGTTTSTSTTTSSTTSTTSPTTTTTEVSTSTTVPSSSSTSTIPAPSTTAATTSSTSPPCVGCTPGTVIAPTTSVALTNPPVPTTTLPSATTSPSPTTTVCDPATDPTCNQIPVTGNEPDLAFLSSALFAGGVALVAVARRRKRTA